jgi:flagellar basal-body rod protein FlgB
MPALEATAVFTERRHRLIAENVANIGVPDYKAKRLDLGAFQKALGEALDRRGHDPRRPLRLNDGRQIRTNPQGGLELTPREYPVQNILFHDGTNLSVEKQMADLAENALVHDMTNNLLRFHYDWLRTAIRGRL